MSARISRTAVAWVGATGCAALLAWAGGTEFVPVDLAGLDAASTDRPTPHAPSRRPYVVVDRGNNRLLLRRGDEVLLEAVVSTGSGATLIEPGPEGRSWQFATPAGRFRVLEERVRPVWVRPDWAFVEAGLPIPERTADRREPNALGEYALSLGDGYLIHGTLYERLLGYSVTHGCVRVGRDDLRALVRQVGPGTPVFIF